MNKTSKSYNIHSPVTIGQIILLFGVMILMTWLTTMLVVPILKLTTSSEVRLIQFTQILTGLLTFMVPPLVVIGYQKAKREVPFVNFGSPKLTPAGAVSSVVLVLLAQPISIFLTWVMSLIPSPEFLRQIESQIAYSTELLLTPHNTTDVILTLVSICIVAPLAEEYFFRGALQGWMIARSKSVHLSVVLVALVFGIIHLEWIGMLPRIVLGLVLGYCAVYYGISTAVFAHAVNNLIVYLTFVVGGQDFSQATFSPQEVILYGIATIGCVWLIIKTFHNQQKKIAHEKEPH